MQRQAEITGIRRVGDLAIGNGILVDRTQGKTTIRIAVRLVGQNEELVWNALLQGAVRTIDFKEEDLLEAHVD